MLDWRRRMVMRAHVSLVIGALLLAGCATGGSSSRVDTERSAGEPSPSAPTRCSAGDPDRWAWLCVLGQILYGIGENVQADTQLRSR
jgi:hypothetical protein